MAVIILCILVVLNFVNGDSIKGLYCQDPDTGKLYPVNSTWRSETFCGNYTCKLRKKNLTETEYTPITRINITKSHIEDLSDDMSISPSENSLVMIKKADTTRQPVFHKDVDDKINNLKEELKNNTTEDGDRYLTESEIKTITEILHTIKKSDLEAIVEIYNIAQEIYKDMDDESEDLVKENINGNTNDMRKESVSTENSISYWYEPLHKHDNKGKLMDLKIAATNEIPSAPVYPYSVSYNPAKDFPKSPYYYPVSNFHRMSSYVHNPSNTYIPQQYVPKSMPKPCKKNMNYVSPPWYNPAPKDSPSMYNRATTQPMLLPYPFSYVHHYNYSYPASYYYRNYPWAQLDVYKRNKGYLQPYYGGYLAPVQNNAIITNVDISDEKYENQNEDRSADSSQIADERPVWQTEQLSAKVLEDIKANIPEKSKILKSLSLKNLKLEKVGKISKIDELLRRKRHINEDKENIDETEEYEAYVERTTCSLGTELGLFRVGNVSEPYPACCPQRIGDKK